MMRVLAMLCAACMLLSGCAQTTQAASAEELPSASVLETVDSAAPELTDSVSIGVICEEEFNYYIETLAKEYMSACPGVTASVSYYRDIAALNVAIASGDGPDLVHISNVPYSSYKNKGLFLDISDLIPENAIYPELISAYTNADGTMDSFPLSFAIGCLSVSEDAAHGRTGWTLEEFLDSVGDSASIFAYDVYALAEVLMDMNLSQFVDPNTGIAELDCELFYDMLDFLYAANQGSQNADTNNSNWFSCMDTTSFQQVRQDGWSLIGWPTPDRTGYYVESRLEFAILTSGKNRERARQFLSFYLTEEGQALCNETAYDFPVRQDVCEKLWSEALTSKAQSTGKDMTEEAALAASGSMVEQSDFEAFCELLTRISCVSRANQDVRNILADELGAFLAGDKTREDTTAIIENRLNIYLSEQQ